MEFVLTLKEGLSRLPEPPDPGVLKMLASALLIPLEYETLGRILCPGCAGHDWESVVRASIPRHQSLEWRRSGPGGDRHTCECKRCGHAMEVTFWFSDEGA